MSGALIMDRESFAGQADDDGVYRGLRA